MTAAGARGIEWIETLDGSRLRVRPIQPSDSGLLDSAFRKLSPESRYRRFLHPNNRLSPRELEYLTRVDHLAHDALVALDQEDEIVGVARFVRDGERPDRAEVAVTVADAWQGRGVGTQLLRHLAARARDVGVEKFTAICLEDNEEMLQLFRELGATTTRRSTGSQDLEVEIALPVDSPAHVLGAASEWRSRTPRPSPAPCDPATWSLRSRLGVAPRCPGRHDGSES